MFQQRHYEAVAKQMRILKASAFVTVVEDTHALWEITVGRLADMFGNDNPRFKPDKFFQACGMEED